MRAQISEGTVLGIDVGYSATERTTCCCILEWDASVARFRFRVTTSDIEQRSSALADLVKDKHLLGVAADGPLTRGLRLVDHYRAADAILSRGVLQKRGKPGQTSSPIGQQLHLHATQPVKLTLERAAIASSTHWEPIHEKRIVEAFPNMYLGALIDEHHLPVIARDASDRYWEVLVENSHRLLKLFEHLLPGRHLETDLRDTRNHERRAGVVCALTALSVAAGDHISLAML